MIVKVSKTSPVPEVARSPVTYCVFIALCLYQIKVAQASPSFSKSNKENEFFMSTSSNRHGLDV